MVRILLVRGMLVGILAGLLGFAFAWLFGVPQVDLAIAFEAQVHRMAGDPPEPELVSRAVQSTIGLFTGVVVYSSALGGIFALVFAYAYGRIGKVTPHTASAILAIAGFIVLILVPQIKYPANPPSIGNPGTIGSRTVLYVSMIALSVIAVVLALQVRRSLVGRMGAWNAALVGAAVYIAAMVIVMLVLPPVNEVPSGFPAVALWQFRLASIGIHAVVWTTLGLTFGALTQRQFMEGARHLVQPRLAG